jgi:hypothetical protein
MSALITASNTAAPTLADQQQRLLRAVTHGNADDGLLRNPSGQREPLLRIYQNAYCARLMSALRDNYGLLPRLMGDAAFEALAYAYLHAHPSHQPSIRWFGAHLPAFMADHDELVPHPAMIDMARMEWALRSAFDAADAAPLQAQALAAVPASDWAHLVLQPHPSLQMLALSWQIEPAWRALHAAAEDEEPTLDAPEPCAHSLIIWRPQLDTRWRSAASPLEALLLHAVLQGVPFAALCEQAAEHIDPEAAAAAVVGHLQHWVGEGLLAGVALTGNAPHIAAAAATSATTAARSSPR